MQKQLLCLWVLAPEASAAFTDSPPRAQDVWMLQPSHRQSPRCTKSFLLGKDKDTAGGCPASVPALVKQFPFQFSIPLITCEALFRGWIRSAVLFVNVVIRSYTWWHRRMKIMFIFNAKSTQGEKQMLCYGKDCCYVVGRCRLEITSNS